MAETFFGQSVFDVRGGPGIIQEQMKDVTRPGVDGTAYAQTGKKAAEKTLTVISMHSGMASVNTLEVALAAAVSSIGSYTQHGLTYPTRILKSVARTSKVRGNGVGGVPDASTWFTLTTTCVVQYAGT